LEALFPSYEEARTMYPINHSINHLCAYLKGQIKDKMLEKTIENIILDNTFVRNPEEELVKICYNYTINCLKK